MRNTTRHLLIVFGSMVLMCSLCVVENAILRGKRQDYCDTTFTRPELQNRTVTAYCRYYGDRFYECTAWNRMLARTHWVLTDGIIPSEMWLNRNEHVQIAECKFYDGGFYRCRGKPRYDTPGGQPRRCAWGGRYEGTAHTGYKQVGSS
ncbi:uncharacterized protein LOC129581545 [Paramacrobiotus metropolitanus]|uniref:uncharacterized protein LOC129581545 n=1 Tax=Paramacrobiotus metropolitanus TaxID=2943436 RepID=UPI002445C730|nr:uncharacterized protein LOC129581545 [Paramacrobiotus metropolitanus]